MSSVNVHEPLHDSRLDFIERCLMPSSCPIDDEDIKSMVAEIRLHRSRMHEKKSSLYLLCENTIQEEINSVVGDLVKRCSQRIIDEFNIWFLDSVDED